MTKALLCALIQDANRTLFIERTSADLVTYGIPSIMVNDGTDQVKALTQAVKEQTGIDAQVTQVALTGRHNVGSRKRRQYVPALAFYAVSKNYKPTVACKWLTVKQSREVKLDLNTAWIIRSSTSV